MFQGSNSTTCDPWTARLFMAVMKNTSDKCSQCLSTCNLTTYRATVTSAEFRSQKKFQQISSSNIFSPCNSRNLNLNPFCDTTNPTLPMWQPDVLASYGAASESRNYIKDLQGPMRPMYPDTMAEKELISSLTQVSTKFIVFARYS